MSSLAWQWHLQLNLSLLGRGATFSQSVAPESIPKQVVFLGRSPARWAATSDAWAAAAWYGLCWARCHLGVSPAAAAVDSTTIAAALLLLPTLGRCHGTNLRHFPARCRNHHAEAETTCRTAKSSKSVAGTPCLRVKARERSSKLAPGRARYVWKWLYRVGRKDQTWNSFPASSFLPEIVMGPMYECYTGCIIPFPV